MALTAHRYRLDPTPEQVSALAGMVGSARWVYNACLAHREEVYKATGKAPGMKDLGKQITAWRAVHPWLKDVGADVAQSAMRDLLDGLSRWLKGQNRKPRFKRKGKCRDSFRVPQRKPKSGPTIRVARLNRKIATIKLPKIKTPIRMRYSRPLVGEIRSVTVSREAGRWYVSILQRVSGSHPEPMEPEDIAPERRVGLDLGVAQSVTTSDGEVFNAPTMSPGDERHLKRLQRRLSRRQGPRKGVAPSEGWKAARAALQRFHARQKRRRLDAIHKFTHLLTSSNLYAQITMEALNTSGMTRKVRGKGRAAKASLNRSILAQSWGETGRQLEYKCERTGIRFAKINPAYTSQKCSACGHVEKANRLTQADFCCVRCGHSDNADLNAAKNIRAAGHVASACRGDVRPQVIAVPPPSLVAAPMKREPREAR